MNAPQMPQTLTERHYLFLGQPLSPKHHSLEPSLKSLGFGYSRGASNRFFFAVLVNPRQYLNCRNSRLMALSMFACKKAAPFRLFSSSPRTVAAML